MDASGMTGRSAEDLIREANHRIANQLSLLTGMIQLQIAALAQRPEMLPRAEVQDLLRTASSRIVAIGNLNRQLASTSGAPIDLCPFLSTTCNDLVAMLAAEDRVKVCENLGSGCRVTAEQASVLCLVINEIIVNALKHARPDGGEISLKLSCGDEGNGVNVELGDNGVGLPVDFDETRQGRVGFKLIRNLLRQIGAGLELHSDAQGLSFRITLPGAQ